MRAKDGRTFGGSQPVTNNCGPANPGLPVTCQLPFEVPTDALEGLVLAIPAETDSWAGDQVTEIDLGISADEAAAFATTDAQVALQQARVVGP